VLQGELLSCHRGRIADVRAMTTWGDGLPEDHFVQTAEDDLVFHAPLRPYGEQT
jgi:hypothetical protein